MTELTLSKSDEIKFDYFDACHQFMRLEQAHNHALIGAEESFRSDRETVMELLTEQERISAEDSREHSVEIEIFEIKQEINRAFFIAGFACFEGSFLRIVDAFLIEIGSSDRVSNLKKNKFVFSRRVLKSNRVDRLLEGQKWDAIELFRNLRNKIAHDNGIFENSTYDNKLREDLGYRFLGLRFNDFGSTGNAYVVLEDSFVRHSFAEYRAFLEVVSARFHEALQVE